MKSRTGWKRSLFLLLSAILEVLVASLIVWWTSYRILCIISFFLLFAVLLLSLFRKQFSEKAQAVVSNVRWTILLFVVYSLFGPRSPSIYQFKNVTDSFLLPAIVLGIVIGAVNTAFQWKERKVWESILQFILVGVLSAAVLFGVLSHANYTFDLNEPEEYIVVIEDTDRNTSRKRRNSYEFIVTVEGQTYDVKVPRDDYYAYEIGDTYRVYRYTGAFGKPFYIAEGFH